MRTRSKVVGLGFLGFKARFLGLQLGQERIRRMPGLGQLAEDRERGELRTLMPHVIYRIHGKVTWISMPHHCLAVA